MQLQVTCRALVERVVPDPVESCGGEWAAVVALALSGQWSHSLFEI